MQSSGIEILQDVSLKPYNTFGIDVKAKFFCEISSLEQLTTLICNGIYIETENKLILGGGSNILLTKDYDGLVIKIMIKGIRPYKNKADNYYISVGAGEVWHDFVLYCIERGFGGVENLSLIPGTVGAAPIQNIGAYGVELKDVLVGVEAVHLKNGNRRMLNKSILHLGYRDSIFKHELKGKYIIVAVHFRVSKKPVLNISYGAIKNVLEKNNNTEPDIKAVSDAVIQIRKSKLPDPAVIGNAGSFFKNPTVSLEKLAELQRLNPDMPNYPVDDKTVKLAAGWLIEQCGWKGKSVGNTGVHKDQALVLVNYGNASGTEIWNLAQDVIKSVKEKFGINLTPEVNIV